MWPTHLPSSLALGRISVSWMKVLLLGWSWVNCPLLQPVPDSTLDDCLIGMVTQTIPVHILIFGSSNFGCHACSLWSWVMTTSATITSTSPGLWGSSLGGVTLVSRSASSKPPCLSPRLSTVPLLIYLRCQLNTTIYRRYSVSPRPHLGCHTYSTLLLHFWPAELYFSPQGPSVFCQCLKRRPWRSDVLTDATPITWSGFVWWTSGRPSLTPPKNIINQHPSYILNLV